ncbi:MULTISPECIES: hypothetical protein [unclassified Acinetobacter]|uniref:hypothetical protein n=1 Tax=unclassified Acinetobacter TaxID=196816 RepID=UPI0015D2E769|nr:MULTISPECIES: hypothetical protein [unclassified Acinetobacter]
MLSQFFRIIAILSLALASLCILKVEDTGTNLCIYEYLQPQKATYFNELLGTSSDDPTLLSSMGIVGIFFFFPLLLSFRRAWYVVILWLYAIFQFIIILMIETASISKIIYDSIVYCHNGWLFTWVIGQSIFIVFSFVYIFYGTETNV